MRQCYWRTCGFDEGKRKEWKTKRQNGQCPLDLEGAEIREEEESYITCKWKSSGSRNFEGLQLCLSFFHTPRTDRYMMKDRYKFLRQIVVKHNFRDVLFSMHAWEVE